jgi:sporulation protein YlmC with PRC-barrel domain
MNPLSIQIVPKRDDARALVPGKLADLGEIEDDYMIADPTPDFRGWKVTLPDGRRVGKVDEIIVDTSTMKAKYVEVKVDHDVLLSDEDRWVLVPIQSVSVDTDDRRVVIDHIPVGGLEHAPRYRGETPTPEEERVIIAYFESTPVGADRG